MGTASSVRPSIECPCFFGSRVRNVTNASGPVCSSTKEGQDCTDYSPTFLGTQMAIENQVMLLLNGVTGWNAWRRTENWSTPIDLTQADLRRADLCAADLRYAALGGANLRKADLRSATMVDAWLVQADLTQARLHYANLRGATLYKADLTGADLSSASLQEADLREANLTKAVLTKTHLHYARLIRTKLHRAKLNNCSVYGISAWDLEVDIHTKQYELVLTEHGKPKVTADNLEVAQFIYLLLNNEKVRHVIDTVTSKIVLILGRFTPKRKVVLDDLRKELRQRNYTPVVFDFDKPASKDLTGTVQTLANMARFIIADLTDPSSVPHELAMVVPSTAVAVQPVLLEGQREYAMFVDLRKRYHWVLEPYRYASPERLIADLSERVIIPAEAKARELRGVAPPTG